MNDPDPELSKLIMDSLEEMKPHTAPAITALYDVIDAKSGSLVGSGTFITLRDRPYILTAGHVVEEATRHKGLAHSTRNEESPRFIDDPMKLAGHPFDLGVVRLAADALAGTPHVPVASDSLADDSDGVESDLLFIHGFPGKKSWPSALMQTVFAESYCPTCLEHDGKRLHLTHAGAPFPYECQKCGAHIQCKDDPPGFAVSSGPL